MQQQSYPDLFPLHSFMDRRFVLTIELGNSTFFLSRNLQLLFGLSALTASLFLHFGAIVVYNKGSLNATLWDLITRMGTKQVLSWEKGWVTSWVRQSEMAWDVFILLRMACHLKLMDFFFNFWNFPLDIFGLQLVVGKRKSGKKGNYCIKKEKFLARRA